MGGLGDVEIPVMGMGSSLGVLCAIGWCMPVGCALLLSVGDSRLYSGSGKSLNIKDYLIGGVKEAVNTKVSTAGRRLLQTCDVNSYSYNGVCYPCPSGSTSNAGSVGYTSCLCNIPTFRTVYDVIYGLSGNLGVDATAYGGRRIFIIRNFIFPQGSTKVGTKISSWTVTTVKPCTIQPFITVAGSDAFFINPTAGEQNNYILIMTNPVAIPVAGTYTFPWTIPALRGGNVLSDHNSMSLGWYDVSGSGNCVSSFVSASATQSLGSWAPLTPLWADSYFGKWAVNTIGVNVALRINTEPGGVPQFMSCDNCPANSYYVNNTQCNKCPTNSISPEGSPDINSCICNKANMFMGDSRACVCSQNYYMSGGTTCNQCPGNLVSPAASISLSDCSCKVPAVHVNSTHCVCGTGTFGDGSVCTLC